MKRKNFLFDAEPTGGGGNTTGGQGGTENVTIEQLQEKIKEYEAEKNRNSAEINSLKSQLGHKSAELEKMQKNGKTQEEVLALEKETLQNKLTEAENSLKLLNLEKKKAEFIKEMEINSEFEDLIVLTPDMDEGALKESVKRISEKQKAFKTEMLKQYSISETAGFTNNSSKNKEDFVDNLVERAVNSEVDLLKF